MISRKILFGAAITMGLSIFFGALGNQNVMLLLTAFSGIEIAFALFLSRQPETENSISNQEMWIFGTLILAGVIATVFFTFPAGLPLFVPAVMSILRASTVRE